MEEKKEIENTPVEKLETEPVKAVPQKAETAELEKAGENKEESEVSEREKSNSKETEPASTGSENAEPKTAEPKTAEATKSEKSEATKPEGTDTITEKTTKKRHGKVNRAAVLVSPFVLLVAVYIGIGFFYRTHFLPNTIVGGYDCSGMKASQAAELWGASLEDYVLEVKGRDPFTSDSDVVLGTITPVQIHLRYPDVTDTLEDIISDQDWMSWIMALLGRGQEIYFERLYYIYDDALVDGVVRGWDACQSVNMHTAQDAYISEYSEAIRGYEVIPEVGGTRLDAEEVIMLVKEALSLGNNSLDLEALGFYSDANILQDDRRLTQPVETANLWLSTSIVYDWNGNEVLLDAETIRDWISIQDGKAILDEEAVSSFVKTQARKYDTYGKRKKFTTTLGVELTLSSASYGWKTDRKKEAEELLQLIMEGSTEPREPIYTCKGMVKVTDSVNDIGDSYVEADLTNQHLYMYQDGEIVLETDFVSGKISNGSGTPEGIFGITYKTTNAVLRGPDYATPVSYWMPFYGNYGMHDATWRSSFGGSIYLNNGSHGCINLPEAMAEQIYRYVFAGFPVICYYYETPVAPEGEELPDPEMEVQVRPAEGEQPSPEQ